MAVRFAGETRTYADVVRRQDAVAIALRAHGVRSGDRVALVLPDSPDHVATFLAAVKLGAIAVPLSTLARLDELAFMLADSGATIVVADPAVAAALAPRREALPALRDVLAPEALLGDGALTAAPTRSEDMCFWQYSSGTTGRPKAVIHAHERALAPAWGHGRHVAAIGPDDLVYSTAKLFFSYGLHSSLVIPLASGASVLLDPERFAAERAWGLVAREHPTVFYAVPSAYAALLAAADAGTVADVSSLRCCVSAGEVLPAPLAARWRRRFGLEILDGIGSTEIGYIAISNTVDDVTAGSSGRVVPGYEVRVSGTDGAEAEEGTLWVRGPSTALGYHDRPERTAATFRDGWVVTGDRYRVQDGRYFHLGRDDDMLRVGAQWVSPHEIEAVLLGHPRVLECAVVGRAGADGLTRACAYIVTDGAAAAVVAELRQLSAERLPHHKRPRWIEPVAELPKTATGKIQRFRLRAQASA